MAASKSPSRNLAVDSPNCSRQASWLNGVREKPMIRVASGSRFLRCSSYRAGTSLRLVRSPEAPKMMIVCMEDCLGLGSWVLGGRGFKQYSGVARKRSGETPLPLLAASSESVLVTLRVMFSSRGARGVSSTRRAYRSRGSSFTSYAKISQRPPMRSKDKITLAGRL